MSNVGYISVTVKAGLFSSERTVSFADAVGRTVSLLVSELDLRDNQLRVDVLDSTSESTFIGLPRDPFSGTRRLVLPASMVQPA